MRSLTTLCASVIVVFLVQHTVTTIVTVTAIITAKSYSQELQPSCVIDPILAAAYENDQPLKSTNSSSSSVSTHTSPGDCPLDSAIEMIQEPAPDFEAEAVLPYTGEFGSIRLSDVAKRDHWTVLFFYPNGFTFVCPTEVVALSDRHAEFAALSCEVLLLSCDSKYTLQAWAKTAKEKGGLGEMRLPLVSDFNKRVAEQYGTLLRTGVPTRAFFLISPSGIVRQCSINDAGVGRNVDEIIRLVKAFQFTDANGEVCPANWQPGDATIVAETAASKQFFRGLNIQGGHRTEDGDVTAVDFSRDTQHDGPLSQWLSSVAGFIDTNTAKSFPLLRAAFVSYNRAMREHPLATKAITSCIIGILGEILGSVIKNGGWELFRGGQRDKRKRVVDPRKIAIFGAYGLLIVGPFFHWWYGFLEASVNKIEHAITGAEDYNSPRDMSLATSSDGFNQTANRKRPLRMLLMKLALNQLVLTPPFLLFTISYIQYFLSLDISKTVQGIKRTYAAALFTNWKVWTVAQAINFQLVPVNYRVLFGNIVALWWNIYLSMTSN